jgi:hypothetical protein
MDELSSRNDASNWRIRLGHVLLVCACAVSLVWIRSYSWGDIVSCGIGYAVSEKGVISFSLGNDGSRVAWGTFAATRGFWIHHGFEIPYGCVVIPLAVVSAWLILRSPRRSL